MAGEVVQVEGGGIGKGLKLRFLRVRGLEYVLGREGGRVLLGSHSHDEKSA